ncbi:MAG: hypothetical protein NT033_01650 [Candidatus Omnitrophica bacterium]|nr:hypothetical protein [Candidatus Omnitrophota bacterium]
MKKHVYVILFFGVATLVFTYPLIIIKIGSYIPAFFSTDETFGALWDSWRIKYSLLHGISVTKTNFVAYPFGINLYASAFISYLWLALTYLLSFALTPVLCFNIQGLFNICSMGFFCYILVYQLTGSRAGAIFSGIAYAFCPYQFSRLWQHLGLTYNQWIPLVLLSLVALKVKNSRGVKVLLFISLLLAFSFDFSVMYFTTIVIASFLIYFIAYSWRSRSNDLNSWNNALVYLKNVFLIGLLVLLILLPQILPIIINRMKLSAATLASASNSYHRSFEDLFAQSARPLSYFLPAASHPVFGGFTEQFIGTDFYGESFTEHALYLGWIPLILAFVAFRAWRKKKTTLSKDNSFYIGFYVLLAAVAWLFSQPPWWKIGPVKIIMPSFFMYKLLPMFRAYCRFGIIVMFAVAVLAGFGLRIVLERFKKRASKMAVAGLILSVLVFEFWNYPPFKVIDVSKVPAVYYWLKGQPGNFSVVEYPLDTGGPNELYKFYQTKHEKRIINGSVPGSYANNFAQGIKDLSSSRTALLLHGMGVKYAIVHRQDYLESDLIQDKEELSKIPLNPDLRLVESFPAEECPDKGIMCVQKTGAIDVYEVITVKK